MQIQIYLRLILLLDKSVLIFKEYPKHTANLETG